MDKINILIDGYDVESIKSETYWTNEFWLNTVAIYVNMGDTYVRTILYNVVERKFEVTSWGDWVEKYNEEYTIV